MKERRVEPHHDPRRELHRESHHEPTHRDIMKKLDKIEELLKYVKSGREKTAIEIEAEVDTYLKKKGGAK